MSQIFDALQRSEGERLENDAGALPAGPELLRRAEKRVASDRKSDSASNGRTNIQGSEIILAAVSEAVGVLHSEMPDSVVSESWTAGERTAFLRKLQTVPVSLEPEGRLVSLTDRDSPTAEALRLLGVRLRDLRHTRTLKKVLITSTIPREGKTTISANLACALAHGSEEKILLVGGDVRIPALLQMFGIETLPGLCEIVLEGRSLSDSIYSLEDAGIWVLPAGRIPSNPLEVLQSQKLPEIIEQLGECFDWIVIDSPPILPLADTTIWMRLADGVLLVTRQGITEKHQLQRGLEALESEKVIGALLNCADGASYGYYYRSSNRT
jgi:capsular exopolysaccharide synthesis family protein